MTRALSALQPGPRAVAIALIAAGVLLIAWGVVGAKARHDRRAMQQAVCAARLEALLARNPFAEKFARNVDNCLALEVATR